MKKIFNKFHSFIYNRTYKFWDNYECPAYWFSRGYEDTDEGCHIYGCIECPRGWKCYMPKKIKQFLVDREFAKIDKYYTELAEKENLL